MPWGTVEEAEKKVPAIKNYSSKGKRAWLSAFNSCFESKGDSKSCYAIAHAAAKQADGKKSSEGVSSDELKVGDYINSRQGEGYIVAELYTGQYMISMSKRAKEGRRVGQDEIAKVYRQGRWIPVTLVPFESRIARIASRVADA